MWQLFWWRVIVAMKFDNINARSFLPHRLERSGIFLRMRKQLATELLWSSLHFYLRLVICVLCRSQ